MDESRKKIQAAIRTIRVEISEKVQLVLVTKTVALEAIRAAYDEGVRDFGENRVQELLGKIDLLARDIRWHLIGHLQTNKVRSILGRVELIQSLDRRELGDEIERQAAKKAIREVSCLLQIKTGDEETQSGFDPTSVFEFVRSLRSDSVIRLRGLMTIAPLTDDPQKIRKAFRDLRGLRDDLRMKCGEHDWSILSMGMSGDYKIAVEEGSNMVRIGTAVFGERKRI